jgi:hypothetical protein
VKLVIETQDLTDAEHERRVGWTESNFSAGVHRVSDAFVYTVFFDEEGNPVRFSGNGVAVSDETRQMLLDLVGESHTHPA